MKTPINENAFDDFDSDELMQPITADIDSGYEFASSDNNYQYIIRFAIPIKHEQTEDYRAMEVNLGLIEDIIESYMSYSTMFSDFSKPVFGFLTNGRTMESETFNIDGHEFIASAKKYIDKNPFDCILHNRMFVANINTDTYVTFVRFNLSSDATANPDKFIMQFTADFIRTTFALSDEFKSPLCSYIDIFHGITHSSFTVKPYYEDIENTYNHIKSFFDIEPKRNYKHLLCSMFAEDFKTITASHLRMYCAPNQNILKDKLTYKKCRDMDMAPLTASLSKKVLTLSFDNNLPEDYIIMNNMDGIQFDLSGVNILNIKIDARLLNAVSSLEHFINRYTTRNFNTVYLSICDSDKPVQINLDDIQFKTFDIYYNEEKDTKNVSIFINGKPAGKTNILTESAFDDVEYSNLESECTADISDSFIANNPYASPDNNYEYILQIDSAINRKMSFNSKFKFDSVFRYAEEYIMNMFSLRNIFSHFSYPYISFTDYAEYHSDDVVLFDNHYVNKDTSIKYDSLYDSYLAEKRNADDDVYFDINIRFNLTERAKSRPDKLFFEFTKLLSDEIRPHEFIKQTFGSKFVLCYLRRNDHTALHSEHIFHDSSPALKLGQIMSNVKAFNKIFSMNIGFPVVTCARFCDSFKHNIFDILSKFVSSEAFVNDIDEVYTWKANSSTNKIMVKFNPADNIPFFNVDNKINILNERHKLSDIVHVDMSDVKSITVRSTYDCDIQMEDLHDILADVCVNKLPPVLNIVLDDADMIIKNKLKIDLTGLELESVNIKINNLLNPADIEAYVDSGTKLNITRLENEDDI